MATYTVSYVVNGKRVHIRGCPYGRAQSIADKVSKDNPGVVAKVRKEVRDV